MATTNVIDANKYIYDFVSFFGKFFNEDTTGTVTVYKFTTKTGTSSLQVANNLPVHQGLLLEFTDKFIRLEVCGVYASSGTVSTKIGDNEMILITESNSVRLKVKESKNDPDFESIDLLGESDCNGLTWKRLLNVILKTAHKQYALLFSSCQDFVKELAINVFDVPYGLTDVQKIGLVGLGIFALSTAYFIGKKENKNTKK